MKTAEAPEVGWGSLRPDPELLPETIAFIEQMRSLPKGQVDALLTRAVPRYLFVHEDVEPEDGPSRSQMSSCTSDLFNWWGDIVGLP